LLTADKVKKLKREGSADPEEITLGEFIQLSEFFTPVFDGDRRKVILKSIN